MRSVFLHCTSPGAVISQRPPSSKFATNSNWLIGGQPNATRLVVAVARRRILHPVRHFCHYMATRTWDHESRFMDGSSGDEQEPEAHWLTWTPDEPLESPVMARFRVRPFFWCQFCAISRVLPFCSLPDFWIAHHLWSAPKIIMRSSPRRWFSKLFVKRFQSLFCYFFCRVTNVIAPLDGARFPRMQFCPARTCLYTWSQFGPPSIILLLHLEYRATSRRAANPQTAVMI